MPAKRSAQYARAQKAYAKKGRIAMLTNTMQAHMGPFAQEAAGQLSIKDQPFKNTVSRQHIQDIPEMFVRPKKKTYYSTGAVILEPQTLTQFSAYDSRRFEKVASVVPALFESAFNSAYNGSQSQQTIGACPYTKLDPTVKRNPAGMKSAPNQYYSSFSNATPVPTQASTKLQLVCEEYTLSDLMFACGGYFSSVAWYSMNKYEKVDDYVQLTFYASSSAQFRSAFQELIGKPNDVVRKAVNDMPITQFNKETPTLLFVDYNEQSLKAQGLVLQEDQIINQKTQAVTWCDQYIFLLPELYKPDKAALKKTITEQIQVNKKYQEINTSVYHTFSGSNAATTLEKYLNEQLETITDDMPLEFFKPSVNIPYPKCVNNICVFTWQPVIDGDPVFRPQFKLSVQPIYSKVNALLANPFHGFYKRPVSRYYPNQDCMVSVNPRIDNVIQNGLYPPLRVGTKEMGILSQKKVDKFFGRETYDRDIVLKLLSKHMAADQALEVLKKTINFKLLYAGTSFKASQFLNCYWQAYAQTYDFNQVVGTQWAIANPSDSNIIQQLFENRRIATTPPAQLTNKEFDTLMKSSNTLTQFERIRKLVHVKPALITREHETQWELINSYIGVNVDKGRYVPVNPAKRSMYQAEMYLFSRFIKSYRKNGKIRGKNPYIFDCFLHTLLGTGVAPSKLSASLDDDEELFWLQQAVRYNGNEVKLTHLTFTSNANGLDATERNKKMTAVRQVKVGEATLFNIFNQMDTSSKLSGDPGLPVKALILKSVGSDEVLVSRYDKLINNTVSYTNRQAEQNPAAVFERYQQYSHVKVLVDVPHTTVNATECYTTAELVKCVADPGPADLLYLFVWRMYLWVLVHYSAASYKGVSDFDVYYFLVHASSWMIDFQTIHTSKKFDYVQSSLLQQLPIYRQKAVDILGKTNYEKVKADAAYTGIEFGKSDAKNRAKGFNLGDFGPDLRQGAQNFEAQRAARMTVKMDEDQATLSDNYSEPASRKPIQDQPRYDLRDRTKREQDNISLYTGFKPRNDYGRMEMNADVQMIDTRKQLPIAKKQTEQLLKLRKKPDNRFKNKDKKKKKFFEGKDEESKYEVYSEGEKELSDTFQ